MAARYFCTRPRRAWRCHDRLEAGQPIDRLALALAAWLRRARGEDERGRPIDVRHPLASELRAAAIAGGADPRPLLSIEALFGDLRRHPRLIAAVAGHLGSLYSRGVDASLPPRGE